MRVVLYLEEIEGYPDVQLTVDDGSKGKRTVSDLDGAIRKLLGFVSNAYKEDAPF